MTHPPPAPRPDLGGSRGRPRLRVAGFVLAGIALVTCVACAVRVGVALASPAMQTLSSPTRTTPVDETMSLQEGRYTVFELTGSTASTGPVTVTESGATTITPQDVTVSDPARSPVRVSGLGSATETLGRDEDLYTGVARFHISSPGDYRVQVSSPAPATVVIGPSIGSGLGAVTGWLIAGGIGGAALLLGMVLIGLSFLGRRSQPAGPVAPTPPGWYPDPHGSGRPRYFDGEMWTEHLHQ